MMQGLTFWTLAIITFLLNNFRGLDSVSNLNGFSFFVIQTLVLWILAIILHMAICTRTHALSFKTSAEDFCCV
jgi:hypothetical protein